MHSMGDMDIGSSDSGSAVMFRSTNMYIARVYWYIVAATVVFMGFMRLVHTYSNSWLKSDIEFKQANTNTRFVRAAFQCIATVTAAARELSYPQPISFTGRFSKYFSPPPLGQCLLLVLYWVVLLCMLWSSVILTPSSSLYAYKWEIVGFRAAWVSITQLPLIYMLSCKTSPLTLGGGITAERVNWFHRWAARTMFFTVAVHWAYFYREWDLGQIVSLEFEMMPMVKYGFGAWAVLGWFLLSGFGLFRHRAFEIFILQHIAAAAVLLWLIWVHVPSYAAYNIWLSIAFIAVDWTWRFVLGMLRNVHVRRCMSQGLAGISPIGHVAKATALPGGYVRLTIRDIGFVWKAGQHLDISIPRLGLFQSHPFTIMSTPTGKQTGPRSIELLVKAHRGMTKRLYDWALRDQENGSLCSLQLFLNGPWGTPPSLAGFDTVVLMATSTGISFTLPLFDSICNRSSDAPRRVRFHWVVRHSEMVEEVRERLEDVLEKALCHGVDAVVMIYYTMSNHVDSQSRVAVASSSRPECSSSTSSSVSSLALKDRELCKEEVDFRTSDAESRQAGIQISPIIGRPDFGDLLLSPIEEAEGETALVGCGNISFAAQLRNYTSSISDERAVHKGTGAHGIFLHIENYGL